MQEWFVEYNYPEADFFSEYIIKLVSPNISDTDAICFWLYIHSTLPWWEIHSRRQHVRYPRS